MTQTIILRQHNRQAAHRLIDAAPDGYVCKVSEPKRSTDQNAKLWAMLSDVSRAMPEGRRLTPEVWKSLFLHSLGHTQRFEMALDGKGMIPTGFSSSRLTVRQMSDLIEFIHEYGARHNVAFTDS